MSKKTIYIHAENNNKILSSNEVRLYVPPEPEKMKVLIWGKELCNMAEWNDFLKRVEEKTEENNRLKQQLEEKDKEIDYWKDKTRNKILNMKATDFMKMCLGCGLMLDITESQVPLAVRELEKVKVNLKDRISMMKNEEHSYLQKVVAWYDICDQINKQIKVLKGEQQ